MGEVRMNNWGMNNSKDSWKRSFEEHVTGVAFNLQLSKNMIRALCLAKCYHDGDASFSIKNGAFRDFGMSVPSMKCLISRGLIEHHDLDNRIPEGHPLRKGHRWYTLTPAGVLVYNLCVMAGLIEDEEIKEKAA